MKLFFYFANYNSKAPVTNYSSTFIQLEEAKLIVNDLTINNLKLLL